FAGDPNIVGQRVELNDHPFTVVGIAPREFHGTFSVMDMDAYVPFRAETGEDPDNPAEKIWTSRGYRSLTVMGRLKPGVTIKQAQASLQTVSANCTWFKRAFGMGGDPSSLSSAPWSAFPGVQGVLYRRRRRVETWR